MITMTEKGILIEIRGFYGAEDITILNEQLLDALQIASGSNSRGSNYYWVFLLLQSIAPAPHQLKELHPSSDTISKIS